MTDDQQNALNEALAKAASVNDAAQVAALLKQGADVNMGGSGNALHWAAYKGCPAAAKVLLEAGADSSLLDSDSNKTAMDYAREGGDVGHQMVKQLLQKFQSPDEVTVVRAVGSSLMEEVFDFSRLERVSILYPRRGGAPVAFQRDSFSAIEDEASLRNAFNLHVKRGGKAEESAVFPNKLVKQVKLS